MKTIDLSQQNSVMNRYMAELRDVNYQQNRLLFRNNIERVGEYMAFEMSKTLTSSNEPFFGTDTRWEPVTNIFCWTRHFGSPESVPHSLLVCHAEALHCGFYLFSLCAII